jgi:hypothetical protein
MTDIIMQEASVNTIAEATTITAQEAKRLYLNAYQLAWKKAKRDKQREAGEYVSYTPQMKHYILNYRAKNLEKRKEYERELYAKNIEARRAKDKARKKLKREALKESETQPLKKTI